MHILLTGATGFVGAAVADHFYKGDNYVLALVRNYSKILSDVAAQHICNLIDLNDFPEELFCNIDCVIHSAARSPMMAENSLESLNEYRLINRDATLKLAKLASENGVKRFIYLSSIKVNGEKTFCGTPFKPEDRFVIDDPYGVSKLEAEEALIDLASKSKMEVVIIRPPLVYGPRVRGNFASMVSWVKKGVPLPFGSIKNVRSFIALDNLVDFILLCADRAISPKAANQVFLVSDGEDVSTSTLLRKVAKAYGVRSRLLPLPVSLMRLAARLLGKSDMADRLFGDLQVDSSKARDLLGWKPVVTMDEQLRKMAKFDKCAGKS